MRKKIPLLDISKVDLIDNKYRFSPKAAGLRDWRGYHVFTFDKKGVLIRLKGSSLGIILGFTDSEGLKFEIEKRLKITL